MDLIPVLDVSRGVAVHAKAGDRAAYRPVESRLAPDRPGDPLALVRAYRERLGIEACYLADLDAIQGGPIQSSLIRELAELCRGFAGTLLVDAGVRSPAGALEVLARGASEVVVGLETLRAFADLAATVRSAAPARVAFSLDLRLGAPVLHPALEDARGPNPDPLSLAAQAAEAGVGTILVLDLARVGTGVGVDLGLLAALRRRLPRLRLLAGGGVLTRKDLERMADAGCDGALVASAIHAGRITAEDVAAVRWRRAPDQSDASTSR